MRVHGFGASTLALVRFPCGIVDFESVLQNIVFLEFWISFAAYPIQQRFEPMFPVVLRHQRAGAAERRHHETTGSGAK